MKRMRGPKEGLSFLEVVISVLILSIVTLYVLPFFLTMPHYAAQEKQILQASLFTQSILERMRQSARIYTPCGGCDFYDSLDSIYSTSNPYANPQVLHLLTGTPYDPAASYIVAYGDGAGADTLSKNTKSKKIVIHLEWNIAQGGQFVRETYTAEARVSRPSGWFTLSPLVLTTLTTSNSTTTSTSTTSTTTTSTTTTTTTSTSSTTTTTTATTTTSTTTTTLSGGGL